MGLCRLSAALVGLFFLTLLACSPGSPTPGASPPRGGAPQPPAAAPKADPPQAVKLPDPLSPSVAVRAGVLGTDADAATYIAFERGYFKELGLEVDLVRLDSAVNAIPFLSTGELEVAGGGINSGLFNAFARGLNIKIVAGRSRWSKGHGFSAYVARKDLVESGTLKDFRDLKGRRVGIPQPGTIAENSLEAAIAKGGLTVQDVTVTQVGNFQNVITAIANGSIDLGFTVEPFVARSVSEGIAARWKGLDEIMPDAEVGTLLYSPQFAERQPEAAKRFMVAWLKGLRDFVGAFDYGQDTDGVIEALSKHTGVNPSVYRGTVPIGMPPDGYANAKSIVEQQDWLAEKGLVREKVDLRKVIDHSFVDYALQVLGRYQPPR